jgi:hypothetical protein
MDVHALLSFGLNNKGSHLSARGATFFHRTEILCSSGDFLRIAAQRPFTVVTALCARGAADKDTGLG